MGMEEALNEEYAHVVTARVLQRLNIPEALQAKRDHPESMRVRGAYHYYRAALDDILNLAKVAPEEREDFIRHLRFEVPPCQRARVIGERIARVAEHAPGSPTFNCPIPATARCTWWTTMKQAGTGEVAARVRADPARASERRAAHRAVHDRRLSAQARLRVEVESGRPAVPAAGFTPSTRWTT